MAEKVADRNPHIDALLKGIERTCHNIASLGDDSKLELVLRLLRIIENVHMGDQQKQNVLFREAEKLGIHILKPDPFNPIPDTRYLKDDLWSKDSELSGVDFNEQQQIELLSLFQNQFKKEYEAFEKTHSAKPYIYHINNGMFESVDGEILYCMIRNFKPKRILEVGSPNAAFLCVQAISKNKEDDEKYSCELVAIEPNSNEIMKAGFPGLSKLISEPIQNVPESEFTKLEENDIFFIDSNHVVRIGSDTTHEYLNIIPRLKKGVIIHVHDVFLPAEYPKWVLGLRRFWNEQYLLQAFLAFNSSFKVLWAASFMHLKHSDMLEAAFSSYKKTQRWPGSFWMQKIK